MSGRTIIAPLVAAAALLVAPAAPAAGKDDRPIVAVFVIQDRTGQLSATACELLTEYLSVKLAEGGVFQIVPSRTIKDRLTELRKESLKDCYDEQCQIEIGKELAASKSLSTSIVQMGDQCQVLGTLYDLRRAASEASASERSACAQDDLVRALEKVAGALRDQLRPREPSPAAAGPQGELVLEGLPAGARVVVDGVFRGQAPLRERLVLSARDHDVRVERPGHEPWQKLIWIRDRKVARERVALPRIVRVSIDSSPPGARLALDGQRRGATPIQIDLAEGRSYSLALEREDREAVTEQLVVRAPYRESYVLEPTPGARRSRLEWAGVELAAGGSTGEYGQFSSGLGIQPLTLRWPRVFWTLVEAGIGRGPSGPGYSYLGTRAGVPLYFGRRDQHQLRLGLGLGWGMVTLGRMFYTDDGTELGSGGDPLHLSLTAHYTFQTAGRLQVAAGLRLIIPVTSSLQTDLPVSVPPVVLFTVPFSFASRL